MEKEITIFYSWQSDLPKYTNLSAIRQALREASSRVENELDELRINVDEATRNTIGSPNIPKTIFDKIEICDIFICDLSVINFDAPTEFKRTPNPNILIELGYAVAKLGWDRIVMLFNTKYGNFPNDLPFDIDRHRTAKFTVGSKDDKSGKNQLVSVLKSAIQSIVIESPLKPDQLKDEAPEQKKRRLDIISLKSAMEMIHIPTLDYYIDELPDRIPARIYYFKNYFLSVVESSLFHIYDSKLSELLTKFKKDWDDSSNFSQHFKPSPNGKYYFFNLPMDMFINERDEKDYKKIKKLRSELYNSFKNLLAYIRNNFIEIDLEETSKKAFEIYTNDIETERTI